MAIKLIALDLDGTLLSSDKTISEKNKAALAAAREKGVQVVLTTGRPLAAIRPFLEDLDLLGAGQYSITFNGGLIQENTGQVLVKTGFNKEAIKRIYETTRAHDLPLDLVQEGTVYVLPARKNSLYSTCNPLLDFVPTRLEELADDVIVNKAVTAIDSDFLDATIPQLPTNLHEEFEIFKSRDILLEWSPKGVHKASGLAQLIAHLRLTKEEVMACGDEENDLTMVEWAGLGVAMANASDALKQVADVVLPVTNDQDGIAYAVENYVLRKE